ncbi:hypothetical protein ABT56_16355 [Photobacterium aquae]|uniref:Peptidase S1 domain-containing protein n=1 Tax=Photobacterium aquae TaxID=1195763 RepID=A0A0J1GWZ5_9GAMM|nr:trypsin-like serine protease [Photobacterium aquae]KLV04178.1 hypothetical protein ABT56_16355 [Photobacterium aquae]
MKKALLALATSMLLPSMMAGASNVTPYVVGGDPVTDISNHSWMASLRVLPMDNAHNCGASVISENWALTAAHCVVSYDSNSKKHFVIQPHQLNLAVGSPTLELTDVGHLYSISHVVVHPDYSPGALVEGDFDGSQEVVKTALQNDIALLRVSRPFPSDSVTPITLAAPDVASEIDTRLAQEWDPANRVKNNRLSGWGFVDPGASILPNELQEAYLTHVPIADCFALIEQGNGMHGIIASPFDQTKICTIAPEIRDDIVIDPDDLTNEGEEEEDQEEVLDGDYGADSCKGDSGGPLRAQDELGNWVQVGIVSGGVTGIPTCGSVNRPSFYTRVGTYYNWVMRVIAKVPENPISPPAYIIEQDKEASGNGCNPNADGISPTNCEMGKYVDSSGGSTGWAWLLTLAGLGFIRRKR